MTTRPPDTRKRRGAFARALGCWLLAGCGVALPARASLQCPPPPAAEAVVADPATPYAQGLLWKITKAGARDSFVYGSIHLADPAIAAPSPAVLEALRAARAFGLEVLFDDATLARVAGSMQAPPPGNLGSAASGEMLREAERRLAVYGVDPASARQLKPWAAWTTLGLPPSQASAGEPLDLRLLAQAREAGVEPFGLETLDEQVAVFDAIPLPDQLALLQDALCFADAAREELAATIAAWQREDLAWLRAAGAQQASPAAARLMQRLLEDRNVHLAERLLPRLHQGGVFAVVGAAHLPGSDGVLARLARAGFAVSRAQ